jgi:hypothetical protein
MDLLLNRHAIWEVSEADQFGRTGVGDLLVATH